jgi:hypothetical protein
MNILVIARRIGEGMLLVRQHRSARSMAAANT